MVCPTCADKGLKSCVTERGSESTLAYSEPFWDEEGRYHNHDPNTVTTHYECSNGHSWTVATRSKCWCGVGG
jgi:hypothetical protein